MTSILGYLEPILAAAEFGRTRDTGEITLKSEAVRTAARLLGYREDISREEMRRAMRLCGFLSHTKTSTGTTYVMRGVLNKALAVDYAIAYATRVNHLEGPLSARFFFPDDREDIGVDPREFVAGVPLSGAAYIRTIANDPFYRASVSTLKQNGAYVALHFRSGVAAAKALSVHAEGRHNVADEDGDTVEREGKRVSLHVDFPDGTAADFTDGTLVHRLFGRGYEQYVFFFNATNLDY